MAPESLQRTISTFKIDRVNVADGYDVHPDWQ
jgi:hypothetical protein